ncbi:retrovirus-related pol polyprotein from transposon TNT 1-94 [Tanacetum coccineum]
MKEKGDPCVMVGYSTQSKGYRVYNKRTRLIVESIHIKFDEIKEMMSDHNSSDLAPQRQEMSVENVSSGLVPQGQKAPLLEEYYNPAHGHAEDNNNDQAPNASFQEAEFINPFCTRMGTRDHPLEQVSWKSTSQFKQDDSLPHILKCGMFALTMSKSLGTSRQTIWQDDYKDNENGYGRSRRTKIQTVIRNKAQLVAKVMLRKREGFVAQPEGFVDHRSSEKSTFWRKALYGLKHSSKSWFDKLSNFPSFPDVQSFTKHFQMLIMPDALILGKDIIGGYSSLVDKNQSYDPTRTGGSTQGYPILDIVVLVMMEMNVFRIMPTKIELTLEQSQQGVSNDVLVSIEGVEE